VVVSIENGAVSMQLTPVDDAAATLELEPAARLLLLWGRREPSAPIDLNVAGDERSTLEALFGW
jgi:hypothetical protein